MAEVTILIPKELGLTKEQIKQLEKGFQKQLADTVSAAHGGGATKSGEKKAQPAAKSKSKSEVVAQAKSKSQIV